MEKPNGHLEYTLLKGNFYFNTGNIGCQTKSHQIAITIFHNLCCPIGEWIGFEIERKLFPFQTGHGAPRVLREI